MIPTLGAHLVEPALVLSRPVSSGGSLPMAESILFTSAHTEELNADTQAAIIHVCRTAHQEDDFIHLFSYIPSGGIHVLAYREQELVSHAVATTRWLQVEGLPLLRTAYVDAVATLPAYQGQ